MPTQQKLLSLPALFLGVVSLGLSSAALAVTYEQPTMPTHNSVHATTNAVKQVGEDTVEATKDVGKSTVDAAHGVGTVGKDAVKDTGQAVKDVGQGTADVLTGQ